MGSSRPVVLSAAIATAAAIALAGCGSAASRPHTAPLTGGGSVVRGTAVVEPQVSPAAYAAGDLQFGLALLTAWCAQDPDGNIVLSPESLATGLGMAYLGARGATAQSMAAVLHLPAGAGASLEAGLQSRARALRELDGPGVTVAGSDQVWADPKLLPLPGYLNAVATSYDAGLGRVPLLTDPTEATAKIDAAVAAATRGHIPHLFSPADLAGSIFVLTDALYLNARWATAFQPARSFSGAFAAAGGQQVTAHYLAGHEYAAAIADGWTAVSLPYRGGKLAMTALLPPAGASGCPDLTSGLVTSLEGQLAHQPADTGINLPQVSLDTQAKLNGLLSGLGMGIAFSSAADFSGMAPQAAAIGIVEHAATLKVDAGGTVASAATGVGILPTAMQGGPVITFNRPYLMLITDTQTGEPLFLARVANPDLS
jgi:serine protease inhibitor